MSKISLEFKQAELLRRNQLEQSIPVENIDWTSQDMCRCGRRVNKKHCVSCGSANVKPYRKTQIRRHPKTGVDTRFQLWHCDGCAFNFDSYDYIYNCQAPPPITKIRDEQKQKRVLAMYEEGINKWMGIHGGNKVHPNFKAHFEKVTGMNYDEYIQLPTTKEMITHRRNRERPVIQVIAPTQEINNNSVPAITPVITPKSKYTPIKIDIGAPKGFAHKDAYAEHCCKCSGCDMDVEPCEVGLTLKALMIAEAQQAIAEEKGE